MAITVDTQDNPAVNKVGKTTTDATIINSGFDTGFTSYSIKRLDGNGETINISKGQVNPDNFPQILFSSAYRLDIILDFRTWYQVKCINSATLNGAETETAWLTFKTRDKRYQSPDAINQEKIDPTTVGIANINRNGIHKTRIIVTNVAKATVVNSSSGATVTNTDVGANTTSVAKTNYGAKVVSKDARPRMNNDGKLVM